MNFPKKLRSGFSLIEVTLAIAIGGLVLAGTASFVYSMSQIWINSQKNLFLDKHIEGCIRFLETLLRPSSLLPEVTYNPGMERPPGYSDADPNLLVINTREASPLFYWGNGKVACGELMVALYFSEKEGLSALWYPLVQQPDGLEDVYKTLLSPLATKYEYCYFDRDVGSWKTLEESLEEFSTDPPVPDLIRLTFKHEGQERVVLINLSKSIPAETTQDAADDAVPSTEADDVPN